jgi:hypothetical protein
LQILLSRESQFPSTSIWRYQPQLLIDAYSTEFSEESHQGSPAETQRDIHGPIVMPLPSFHAVAPSKPILHGPSTSSLRDKGVLVEPELVFYSLGRLFFLLSFLNLFLFAAKPFPFFLARSRLTSINPCPIFTQLHTIMHVHTRTTLCLFRLSSFLPLN